MLTVGRDGAERLHLREVFDLDDQGPAILAILDEAEAATLATLRRKIAAIGERYRWMRTFAHSFEHAAIVVAPDAVAIADADGSPVQSPLVVWNRRREGLHGVTDMSDDQIITEAEFAGQLALDLAQWATDARLRFAEVAQWRDDHWEYGTVHNAIPHWFHPDDVSEQTLNVFRAGGVTLRSTGEPT